MWFGLILKKGIQYQIRFERFLQKFIQIHPIIMFCAVFFIGLLFILDRFESSLC